MKRKNIHRAINCRIYIQQNKQEFDVLSDKFGEPKYLMMQFVNYSLPIDAERIKLK